jgi:hypothetical protein
LDIITGPHNHPYCWDQIAEGYLIPNTEGNTKVNRQMVGSECVKHSVGDEAEEEEAEADVSELIRIQQEMERLRQEQESIMRS